MQQQSSAVLSTYVLYVLWNITTISTEDTPEELLPLSIPHVSNFLGLFAFGDLKSDAAGVS